MLCNKSKKKKKRSNENPELRCFELALISSKEGLFPYTTEKRVVSYA